MLKHENPNIEIINKNLWAVRFSLIPFIPQISYEPDPDVPVDQVPGQLAPGGLMILNKDYRRLPCFSLHRQWLPVFCVVRN